MYRWLIPRMERNDWHPFVEPYSLPAVSGGGSPSIGGTGLLIRTGRGQSRPRVALYSHDTVGLGHFRRNLAIAEALAASPLEPHILLITGSLITRSFDLPVRTDCITLPSFGKDHLGAYRARSLTIDAAELTELRRLTIEAALLSFHPDILIVDKTPLGLLGELGPALEGLRSRGATRCVLGLREILDSPEVARREWRSANGEDAVRNHYEAVWIYGDRRVYDSITEYAFSPAFASKSTFTGYIARQPRATDLVPALKDYALCWLGGGDDGHDLAHTFASASFPKGLNGVIVSGPFMPRRLHADLSAIAARCEHLSVVDFVDDPQALLRNAASVVSMGGYNSVCEVISFGKRALIVPRVQPRAEQLIRAERMSRLGILEYLHPNHLSSQALSKWLQEDSSGTGATASIDMSGLKRIPGLVAGLLGRCSNGKVAHAAT